LLKKILHAHSLKLEGVGSLVIIRSIFALLWLILAGAIVAEIVGRTPLGYVLPPPSVGADSFEFDIKVYYLEQSIRQRGALDCLIIGDSMTNNGLDPILIEEAYQAETGSDLHCFNFGIPALMLDASGPLTTALNNRFHPRLLIVILSPRDFNSKFGAPFRHVAFSDWTQQNLGNTSPRGWTVNSVYGYRYALFFEYWLTPSNRSNFLSAWNTITRQGFSPLHGYGDNLEIAGSGSKFEITDTSTLDGFEQILKLPREGNNLLIIDAPVRNDYYEVYRENFFFPYIEHMQSILDSQDVPFWLTGELSMNISRESWYDYQHLNERGVPILNEWLGKKLAQQYPPEFFK